MTIHYKYSTGSGANDGLSALLPKKTFGTNVVLVAGVEHRFCRGETWPSGENDGRIGIIGATGTSEENRAYLGAYGTGAMPLFDGEEGGVVALIWIRHGNYITIEDLHASRGYYWGIKTAGNSASETPNFVTLRRCKSSDNNYSLQAGGDGVSSNKSGFATVPVRGLLWEDCLFEDEHGHGAKFRSGTEDSRMHRCVAWKCGKGAAGVGSHGMGTCGRRSEMTEFVDQGSGVWSQELITTELGEPSAPTFIDSIFTETGDYFHNRLTFAGATTTPTLGQYGIVAGVLYVNVGEDPVTVYASKNGPKNNTIDFCLAYETIDYFGGEGMGIYADEFSTNTVMTGCVSHDNEGDGYSFNVTVGGTIQGSLSYNNPGYGCGAFGPDGELNFLNNTFIAINDTDRAILGARGTTIVARNNIFVGGQYGIEATSSTADTITEDHNCFYGQSSQVVRLQGVSQDLGEGTITTNPLLTTDYRLSASSPCRETGVYVAGARHNDGRRNRELTDMGAFRYRDRRFVAINRATVI